MRVLVVNSDAEQAERLTGLLAGARHTALPTTGLEEAAEALFVQKFDAVLLASPLPSDGVADFKAKLRNLESRQRNATPTPVLSISSELPNGADWCAGKGGADQPAVDGYLADCFPPEALSEAVASLSASLLRTASSAENSSELPIFEVEQFRAQVSHDDNLVREIIDLFRAESPGQMIEMCEALAAGEFDRLSRVAHTIKGSFAALHAERARSHAQEIESAAKDSDTGKCQRMLSALEHDLEVLDPQLLSLRDAAQRAG